jgi:carbonic anhydrase
MVADPITTRTGIPLGAAHIIWNAGDAFRSPVITQQLLGTTKALVVKHTGYGMLMLTTKQPKTW